MSDEPLAAPEPEPAKWSESRPPWRLRDLGLVVLEAIALSLAAAVVYGFVVALLVSDPADAHFEAIVIVLYVAVAVAVFHLLRRRAATWADVGFRPIRPRAWAVVVPAYIGLVIAEGIVAAMTAGILGDPPSARDQLVLPPRSLSMPEIVILVVGSVVLAPVIEELLFRGLLFRYLRSRYGFAAAAAGSAILFAVLHGFLGLLAIFFVFGVVTAWLVERYQSLLPAIGVHVIHNAVALTLVLTL